MGVIVGFLLGMWIHWCLAGEVAKVSGGKNGSLLVAEYNGALWRMTKLEE